jgi:hypothetical protein
MTQMKLKIRDLAALADAAPHVGLEFREGQTQHSWYGHFVGDSQPPAGRDPKDYGKCEHALRLTDHRAGDYEIGVVKALDGDGYELMMDEWGPGQRLLQKVGPRATKLQQEYAASVAVAKAKQHLRGWAVQRTDLPSGRIKLAVRKR